MVLNEQNKCIAIVGPTASGKSSLAYRICKKGGFELISCDSMQIYKGMDIGTAKPSKEEQSEVVHHMIDIVEPNISYSVSDYASEARKIYFSLIESGKNALVCGGTGLYLDAFLGSTDYNTNSNSDEVRIELNNILETKGKEYLHSYLCEIDPESGAQIHYNNVKRVIRAIEIYKVTGMTKTEYDKLHKLEYDIPCTIIGLDYKNRDILRDRIYKRVDQMISLGLIEEVERLYRTNMLLPNSTSAQGIGYKETISYLNGEFDKDTLIEKIKNRTAQYAKRQLTWFRKNKNVNWLYLDTLSEQELVEEIKKLTGVEIC